MKDYKYALSIEQSHSFMSDQPDLIVYKLHDISEILLWHKNFSQIGKFPESVRCKQIAIGPKWLTITPFISSDNDKKAEEVLEKLNAFVRDDLDEVEVKLTLDELPDGNYQIIRMWKMKG